MKEFSFAAHQIVQRGVLFLKSKTILSKVIILVITICVCLIAFFISRTVFFRALFGGISYDVGKESNTVTATLVYKMGGGYRFIISGNGYMSEDVLIPLRDELMHISYGWKVSIESVTVEEGVVSITPGIFFGCGELKTVFLPHSLEQIGVGAFSSCRDLKSVNFEGTMEEWKEISDISPMWSDTRITKEVICTDGTVSTT